MFHVSLRRTYILLLFYERVNYIQLVDSSIEFNYILINFLPDRCVHFFYRGVESPTMIVVSSISPISFCLMRFDALLGVYTLRIVRSFQRLGPYHYVMPLFIINKFPHFDFCSV